MAWSSAQASPSTTKSETCCLCVIPTTEWPALSQQQAPKDVALTPTKKVASTFYFNHPWLGFSHAGKTWFGAWETWCCRLWTENQEFHISNAMFPTWFGDWDLSFRTLSLRLCHWHHNNVAIRLAVSWSSNLHNVAYQQGSADEIHTNSI
jgi:hypothetical protein